MSFKAGDKVRVSANATEWAAQHCVSDMTYTVHAVRDYCKPEECVQLAELLRVNPNHWQYSWKFELVQGVPCMPPPHINGEVPTPQIKNLNVPGAKDDSEKVRIDLILNDMPRALLAVAEIATFGAKKYTEGGWLTVPEGPKRYRAALQRHMLNENIDPDGLDPETKKLHAAHAAWNALARLELLLRD